MRHSILVALTRVCLLSEPSACVAIPRGGSPLLLGCCTCFRGCPLAKRSAHSDLCLGHHLYAARHPQRCSQVQRGTVQRGTQRKGTSKQPKFRAGNVYKNATGAGSQRVFFQPTHVQAARQTCHTWNAAQHSLKPNGKEGGQLLTSQLQCLFSTFSCLVACVSNITVARLNTRKTVGGCMPKIMCSRFYALLSCLAFLVFPLSTQQDS